MKFIFDKTLLLFLTQNIIISRCTSQLGSDWEKELFINVTDLGIAAIHNDAKHATKLINAGHDVNAPSVATYNGNSIINYHRKYMMNICYTEPDIGSLYRGHVYNSRCRGVIQKIENVTPLHIAARYNSTSVIKELIVAEDININAEDGESATPLHVAASRGHSQVVQLLSSTNEADINKPDSRRGHTPLFVAAKFGYADTVEVLDSLGSQVNLTSFYGNPFNVAVSNGHVDIVKFFMSKYHIDISAKYQSIFDNEQSALLVAVEEQQVEMVKYLIDSGADVNMEYLHQFPCENERPCNINPLREAVKNNNTEIAKYLLRAGAANLKKTLPYAVKNNNLEMAKYLIEAGAEVNKSLDWPKDNSNIPLIEAIKNDNLEMVNILVEVGSAIPENALPKAAEKNNSLLVKYLIESGANVNLSSSYLVSTRTPLVAGVEGGNVEIVNILIEAGADLNEASWPGSLTPLVKAVQTGNFEIVKSLVEAGADMNVGEGLYRNALTTAIFKEHAEIVKYLLNAGARPCKYNIFDALDKIETPHADFDIIKYLISAGIDLNEQSKYGAKRALIDAIQKNHVKLVKYLVSAGADVNVTSGNDEQKTALFEAIRMRSLEMVKTLVEAGVDTSIKYWGKSLFILLKEDATENVDLFKYLVNFEKDKSNIIACDNLFEAISSTDSYLLHFLLTEGADPNCEHDGKSAIFEAIEKNKWYELKSIDTVKYLIQAGANVNDEYRDRYPFRGEYYKEYKRSPLIEAVMQGNLDLVKILCEAGADIDKTFERVQALFDAIHSGKKDVVKYLIDAGANVNMDIVSEEWIYKETPLITAVSGGHLEIARNLIEANADPNFPTVGGQMALSEAIISKHLDMVKYLIEIGTNVNKSTSYYEVPPIVQAIANAYGVEIDQILEIVKVLIEASANTIGIEDGQPLLFAAIDKGNLELFKFFVESGAKIGNTSLINATLRALKNINKSNFGIIKYLVEAGVDSNAKTDKGEIIFFDVVKRGLQREWPEIVKYFIDNGGDVNITSDNPMYKGTLLQEVMSEYRFWPSSSRNIASVLLEEGADITTAILHGKPFIFFAVENDDMELVKLLTKHNADINQLMNGESILLATVKMGKFDLFQHLVDTGANIEPIINTQFMFKALSFLKKWNEWTGRYRERKENNDKVYDLVKFIIDSGANPNIPSEKGKLVLMEVIIKDSVSSESTDMVKYLIDIGIDVNATSDNYENRTAILEAIQWGDIELIKILLEAEANTNVPENEKPLLFIAAEYSRSSEKIELLVDHGLDVNVTWNGKSLLYEAINKGDEKLFKLLIELGINTEPVTNGDVFFKLFHQLSRNPGIAKGLLDIGFNTNVPNSEGKTALIKSVIRDNVQLVKDLLAAGADPNLASQEGKIPLFEAIKGKNVDIVQYLIEAGADVNAIEDYYNQETPLIKSITLNELNIVKALVEGGSDLNATFGGESILLTAIKAGGRARANIFTFLVEAGAQLESNDNDVLYEAVANVRKYSDDKEFPILKYLIKSGADVNKKTEGVSILYRAVGRKSVNLIKYLVSEGASINQKSANWSPKEQSYYERHESKYDNVDESFPLIYSAVGKQLDIVEVLLENGADVGVRDSDGKTALDYIMNSLDEDVYGCTDCIGIKNLLQNA